MSRPLKLPDLRCKQKKSNILWKFIVHIFTGTVIFLVILFIALGLSKIIHLFQDDADGFVIMIFIYAERITVCVDVLLYLLFIVFSSIKFLKKLF